MHDILKAVKMILQFFWRISHTYFNKYNALSVERAPLIRTPIPSLPQRLLKGSLDKFVESAHTKLSCAGTYKY